MHKNIQDQIEAFIEITINKCESWLKRSSDGKLNFIDPIEENEVPAHYGTTHAAASFLILGLKKQNDKFITIGKELLNAALEDWSEHQKLPGFHSDFNNFALCLGYDYLKESDKPLTNRIQNVIFSSKDSNHYTINWLPMRWFVNHKRWIWSNKKEYLDVVQKCRETIQRATNNDGGIEDILPKGKSFNLQYDLATVAVMQFLRCRGEKIELAKELDFLLQNIAPDGDINYQGRGTNQIFAWGMWIYLLSSSNRQTELKQALAFLEDKLPKMLKQDNLMLNDWHGSEKFLWWDYHYASVYTAHFLLWMILALEDGDKKSIFPNGSVLSDTGVSIKRSSNYFISTFTGRTKYLAEGGPVVSAIWLKSIGFLYKGTFGPWLGLFGNKNTYGEIVMNNFFGLIAVRHNIDFTKNRFINKIIKTPRTKEYYSISPLFAAVEILESDNEIQFVFKNPNKKKVILNLPLLHELEAQQLKINIFAENKVVPFSPIMKIKNQYSWCTLYQTNIIKNVEVIVKIRLL